MARDANAQTAIENAMAALSARVAERKAEEAEALDTLRALVAKQDPAGDAIHAWARRVRATDAAERAYAELLRVASRC